MSTRGHAADARRILDLSKEPGAADDAERLDGLRRGQSPATFDALVRGCVYVELAPVVARAYLDQQAEVETLRLEVRSEQDALEKAHIVGVDLLKENDRLRYASTEYRSAVDEFIVAELFRCGCHTCCYEARRNEREPSAGEGTHPDHSVLYCESHAPEGSTRHKAFSDRDAARERLAKAEKSLGALLGEAPMQIASEIEPCGARHPSGLVCRRQRGHLDIEVHGGAGILPHAARPSPELLSEGHEIVWTDVDDRLGMATAERPWSWNGAQIEWTSNCFAPVAQEPTKS